MVIALGQRMAKAAHRGLLRTTHTVLCWTRCTPKMMALQPGEDRLWQPAIGLAAFGAGQNPPTALNQ